MPTSCKGIISTYLDRRRNHCDRGKSWNSLSHLFRVQLAAILLVLLIGTAGYWLFSSALNKESGAVSGSGLESLLKSQAVNLQVKNALAGDKEAMSSLAEMSKTMESFG